MTRMACPPFAPRALPRFITTTKQSAPELRVRTLALVAPATCGFSVSIEVQVPTFHRTASWQAQATSHAGGHSAPKQVSSELVPQSFPPRGFGHHLTIFDNSIVVPLRSSSCQSPDPIIAGPFPYVLTTMAFDHSRQRWFETNSCKPVPRGPPSSAKQLRTRRPCGPQRSWHTETTLSDIEKRPKNEGSQGPRRGFVRS